MSKAVLISIRPKWCEKIASRKKTIEVRKNRPRLKTPFRCYIYETQGWMEKDGIMAFRLGGRVIGEFTCDHIYELETHLPGGSYCVKGEDQPTTNKVARQSCLTHRDMHEYLRSANGYGWHISDLKIYDTPKELNEFFPVCRYKNDDGSCPSRRVARSYQKCDYNPDGSINLVECGRTLERPPQSWCYVEEQK